MKIAEKWTDTGHENLFTPYIIDKDGVESKLIEFKELENSFLLQIELTNIKHDNYRLFQNGQYLNLIISEEIEIERPVYLHNVNWGQYAQLKYDVMKRIIILLPGDNFYLVKHNIIPQEKILNIYLSRMQYN